MLIMAPMMDPTSKYINVMSSFNTKKIRTSFDKDWLTDESSTTDVTVSVWGGKSPYIVKWGLEPGAYEGITKTVGVGDHIVHITDALGNEEIDTVTVGYRVEWLDLVESSYSDGVLAKTSSVANWNSSALSNQVLPANEDGWFEYILDEIEGIKMIGYWNGLDPITSYNNLSYGLYVYPNSTTYVWEGSGSYENVANKKGDVFRIERKGDKIIYTQNGQVIREKNTNRDQEMLIMAPMMDPTSKYINVMSSFNNKRIGSTHQLTLNFQNLPKTNFTLNGPGLSEIAGESGEQSEPFIIQPTAPEPGSTNNVQIHVNENSNDAENNAPMDLKVVYDEDLTIQNVLLVNGENEQPLSSTWYNVEEERILTFLNETPKKQLLPITTNLQGVVYDNTAPFQITVSLPNLFTSRELKVYDREGNLLGSGSETEAGILQWDGTSLTAGLYKFELNLSLDGNDQKFNGQFIVK